MTPTVPQRNAAEHDPGWPDRTKMPEHLCQDARRRNLSIGRKICQMIEKSAGSRVIVPRKDGWRVLDNAAEPMQEVSAPGDSRQRVAWARLESVDKRSVRSLTEFCRVDPQPVARIPRKQAVAEHRQACQCKSFRTSDLTTRRHVAKTPDRTGAGIEQNADDGKVEFRPCARGGGPPMARVSKRRPTVVAIDDEVAPTGMDRNIKRRISFARDRSSEIGGFFQAMQMDMKMLELVGEACLQDQVRTLSHRGRGQQ